MNAFVYFIIFATIYQNINEFYNKKIDHIMFITFLSIILLYREKMAIVIQQIQDFIEFFGRMNGVIDTFAEVSDIYKKSYDPNDLPFKKLVFKDVTFKYGMADKPIFNKFNLTLDTTNHRIIGVTGISGRGKSTFMKLLLKMYKKYEGEIYIDSVNIKGIDPDYIRKNITYVNQNSKLFDKIIIENMMYGCSNNASCKEHLDLIIKKYPKIDDLFQKIDIYNKRSGPLGENLSGGQRQVVNIISGLINPSKILLLDEPTNALDGELKQNVLDVINEFRNYKQCIIIITHDSSVFSLFNERIEM
jgi:ABC-type bacteriocin/lantibiotic exporter with double-glycine peptidase domain